MECQIIFAGTQECFNLVTEALFEGWKVHPDLGVARLDNNVVYHLIKYDDGEAPQEEVQPEKYGDVESIKSVDINDADEYLEQGYTIDATYAKTVTLIKRKEASDTPLTELDNVESS